MKETLIQYQGGGYDGCFWEWNFGFFDKEGKYHDIFSSGRAGCSTQEDIGGYIADKRLGKNYFLYQLTSKKSLKELATENNAVNLSEVLTWFKDNFPEYEPYALCPECGCKITGNSEASLENWHGCGGIMSTAASIICSECRSLGTCGYCGEYYGKDHEDMIYTAEQIDAIWDVPKALAEEIDAYWGPLCIHCAEKILNEKLGKIIKKR